MEDIYTSEFQERHIRNMRASGKVLRFLARPVVGLTVLTYGLYWAAEITNSERIGKVFLFMGVVWTLAVPGLIVSWILKKFRELGEAKTYKAAVSVPRRAENAEALRWAAAHHREVLRGVGLTETDEKAQAKTKAGLATAGLYGKGKVARVATAGAAVADSFTVTKVPKLVQVEALDSTKSLMIFEMLAGQSAATWEKKHDELASGFRVLRVSVSQNSEARASGLVSLTLFHADALADSVEFEDWED